MDETTIRIDAYPVALTHYAYMDASSDIVSGVQDKLPQ
jgi:hypothetical protein